MGQARAYELHQLRKWLRETLSTGNGDEMLTFLASSSAFDVAACVITDWFEVVYSERGNNNRRLNEAVLICGPTT